MATMTLRLQPGLVAQDTSIYKRAKDLGIRWHTAARWQKDPEGLQSLDLDLLYNILRANGYNDSQILGLQLGDLLQIISTNGSQ